MAFDEYFPLGIAAGDAFIDRDEESLWLEQNILSGVHTLLVAPRRYGKSSLALYTLEKSQLKFTEIDLQLARSSKAVAIKIISSIEKLILQVANKKEKILTIASSFFKKMNKKWSIGFKGVLELSLEPEHYEDVADNILTALLLLETLLLQENRRVVIFIDEFQEIAQLKESHEIKGAIRHFAQKTKHITFIFSGSSRRLLTSLFNDKNEPLYQLCDTIQLKKISEESYEKYLAHVAKLTWKKNISPETFRTIMSLTHRHPRRVYNLCFYLWRMTCHQKNPPSVEDVNNAWDKLLKTELKNIRIYLSMLTNAQLKLLAYIANISSKEIASKSAQQKLDLSSTAIYKAAELLEKEDLVLKEETGNYEIVDPLVESVLKNYEATILE